MFLHISQSIVWAVHNIAHANMLLYPLYYDVISLTSLRHSIYYLLLQKSNHHLGFKNLNSIEITECSHNRYSDNQSPTVSYLNSITIYNSVYWLNINVLNFLGGI